MILTYCGNVVKLFSRKCSVSSQIMVAGSISRVVSKCYPARGMTNYHIGPHLATSDPIGRHLDHIGPYETISNVLTCRLLPVTVIDEKHGICRSIDTEATFIATASSKQFRVSVNRVGDWESRVHFHHIDYARVWDISTLLNRIFKHSCTLIIAI